MKVQELIDELNKIPNKNLDIHILTINEYNNCEDEYLLKEISYDEKEVILYP